MFGGQTGCLVGIWWPNTLSSDQTPYLVTKRNVFGDQIPCLVHNTWGQKSNSKVFQDFFKVQVLATVNIMTIIDEHNYKLLIFNYF